MHLIYTVEIKFTEPPEEISPEQAAMLDQHSLLNIFNVIIGQLQILGIKLKDDSQYFRDAMEIAKAFLVDLQKKAPLEDRLRELPRFESDYLKATRKRLKDIPGSESNPEVTKAVDNLKNCFRVLNKRSDDFMARLNSDDGWMDFSIAELKGDLMEVFQAIEKNSGGRYEIVYNLARQKPDDYFININMESISGDTLRMPAVFQDTIRDLVANARKYTPLGGEILVGFWATENGLKFVVEDNGRGISESELSKVVEYGYRAGNVQDRPTMGGGFGLTKALHVVHQFHGTMSIRSQLDSGTRITIEIPAPTN